MTELSISCGAKVFNTARSETDGQDQSKDWKKTCILQVKASMSFTTFCCVSPCFCCCMPESKGRFDEKSCGSKSKSTFSGYQRTLTSHDQFDPFNSIHVDDIKGHSMLCQSLDIRPNTFFFFNNRNLLSSTKSLSIIIIRPKRDKSYKMLTRSLAKKCIQLNHFVHWATFQKLYQCRMFKVRCTTSSYNCLAWPGCQTFVSLRVIRYLKGSNTQYTVNI